MSTFAFEHWKYNQETLLASLLRCCKSCITLSLICCASLHCQSSSFSFYWRFLYLFCSLYKHWLAVIAENMKRKSLRHRQKPVFSQVCLKKLQVQKQILSVFPSPNISLNSYNNYGFLPCKVFFLKLSSAHSIVTELASWEDSLYTHWQNECKHVTPNPKRYSSFYFNGTVLISTIREAVP